LAHGIVTDVALYHHDDIARAAKGEPATGLSGALDEGRRLLAQTVSPRTYAGEDPILEAFRSLIADMRGRT
jgi:hypothetical protein